MLHSESIRQMAVVGYPDGYPDKSSRLQSLPPASTSRWVAKRKAEVVAAVSDGILTIAEACQRYDLTPEELGSWQRAVEREGTPGLRARRVQHHRQMREKEARQICPMVR